MAAGKRHKGVALEKVKHALSEQVRDNADVIAIVERVSKVYALVAIALVVGGERRQHSQLDARGVTVLLNGADDLDGDFLSARTVVGFDDFAKGALAEKLDDGICTRQRARSVSTLELLTSLSQVGVF